MQSKGFDDVSENNSLNVLSVWKINNNKKISMLNIVENIWISHYYEPIKTLAT